MEERYEGKGEGMVYVYHHRHGQGVLIKDLTFCSHCFIGLLVKLVYELSSLD